MRRQAVVASARLEGRTLALASGRIRKRAAAHAQPARDDRNVANSIVSSTTLGGAKQSSGGGALILG
jgi:hypothetical protein